jgi:hypothetical protein
MLGQKGIYRENTFLTKKYYFKNFNFLNVGSKGDYNIKKIENYIY